MTHSPGLIPPELAACRRANRLRLAIYILPALVSGSLAFMGLWSAAVLVFGTAFIIFAWGCTRPASGIFGALMATLPEAQAKRREVWLTLDDGPDPGTTPRLLDLLDARQARAAFFLIGEKAARHPELVRQIASRGHLVGNHSQTHPAAWFWTLPPNLVWREVAYCQQTLAGILGTAPAWFRPPVGHHNIFVAPVARALGLRMAVWSCRGYDAVKTDPAAILSLIERGLRPGAIILLHDATPHSHSVLEGVLRLLEKHRLSASLPRLED